MASNKNNTVTTSSNKGYRGDYMTEYDLTQNNANVPLNNYVPPYNANVSSCKKNNNYSFVSMLYFVVMIFALYLSFICNNGFDLGSFVMALFFPYIYIIYKLATSKNFCDLIKHKVSA